jgi:hypothetical protein
LEFRGPLVRPAQGGSNRTKEEKMRSKFAMLLGIAAVCVTTAWAEWTSESLVTGSTGVSRYMDGNNTHKVVFGTDGVGHLVWQGGPSANPYVGVWYNRYNPGSGSRPGYWGADFAVAPYSAKKKVTYAAPCIALDGDGRTIHVVWRGMSAVSGSDVPDSVCYRRCTQDRRGNDKWDAPLSLYATKHRNTLWTPVVACVPNEPNHVLVCWRYGVSIETGGSSAVTMFREYVNGAWQAVVRLDSSYMPPQPYSVAIAAAPNGDVFVAYLGYDDGTTGKQIFVKTRHNGTWGEPVNVTKSFSSLACWTYAVEVNPITGNPHVVFRCMTEVPSGEGLDTVEAVCHTYRSTSGAWLTAPEQISEPRQPYFSFYPTMAFDGSGATHVAWQDSAPPTGSGILYSTCSSEGGTWSTPQWLTSYCPDGSAFIAADEPAHAVHVVWEHASASGAAEIWWKSNYLGGGGGGMAQPIALSQSSIDLFPNPAKAGRVTVQYSLPRAGQMTATLLDVSGRAVRRSALDVRSSGEGSFALDAKGLNAGVYVLKLESGETSLTRKFVIH